MELRGHRSTEVADGVNVGRARDQQLRDRVSDQFTCSCHRDRAHAFDLTDLTCGGAAPAESCYVDSEVHEGLRVMGAGRVVRRPCDQGYEGVGEIGLRRLTRT